MKLLYIYLKFILLLVVVSISSSAYSQVTIGAGTPPKQGALLDLKENNDSDDNATKGLGLPRVELTDLSVLGLATTSTPEEYDGLTVYNVKETSEYCEGVYVWSDKKWNQITGISPSKVIDGDTESNSFIVKPRNVIRIPIKKAYEVWKNDVPAVASQFANKDLSSLPGALGAKLMWQDTEGLIANANTLDSSLPIEGSGENAYIVVKANTNCKESASGNAMIAFTIGGEVYWSWHLWVTEYAPDEATNPAAFGPTSVSGGYTFSLDNGELGGDFVSMDRSLGATSVDYNDKTKLFGLFYQWGRKDPFPTSVSSVEFRGVTADANSYDASGTLVSTIKTPVASTANLANAISNPTTFYTSSTDWYTNTFNATNRNDALWGQNTTKSVFDPCPKGWRVPDWKKGKSLWILVRWDGWNSAMYPKGTAVTKLGRRVDTGEIYPVQGWRDGTNGLIMQVGVDGLFWTGKIYSGKVQTPHALFFYDLYPFPKYPTWDGSNGAPNNNSLTRASGGAIRCVRE